MLPATAVLDLASIPERRSVPKRRREAAGAALEAHNRFLSDPDSVEARQEAERSHARQMHAEGHPEPLHVVKNLGGNRFQCEMCGWIATGNRCKLSSGCATLAVSSVATQRSEDALLQQLRLQDAELEGFLPGLGLARLGFLGSA